MHLRCVGTYSKRTFIVYNILYCIHGVRYNFCSYVYLVFKWKIQTIMPISRVDCIPKFQRKHEIFFDVYKKTEIKNAEKLCLNLLCRSILKWSTTWHVLYTRRNRVTKRTHILSGSLRYSIGLKAKCQSHHYYMHTYYYNIIYNNVILDFRYYVLLHIFSTKRT